MSGGRRRLAATAAVTAIVVAACGDEKSSTETSAAAAEVSVVATTAPAAVEAPGPAATGTAVSGGEYTDDDYVEASAAALNLGDPDVDRCISRAVLERVGFDEIRATGLSPAELFDVGLRPAGLDLPLDEHESLIADVADCGDLLALFEASGQGSDQEVACAREHLTNELLAETFVRAMNGAAPSDELTAAQAAMDACLAEG